MMSSNRMKRLRAASYGLLLTIGAASAGCAALGAVMGKVAGQPDVPAQYELKKDLPVLVIAENFRDPSTSMTDADRIARLVSDDLDAHKVAPIVSIDQLTILRDAKPAEFAKMTVVDLAKQLGAKQVVYVDLDSVAVGVQTGSDMLKGIGAARVLVIDVDSGRSVFPGGLSEGLAVSFDSPMRRVSDQATPNTVRSETLMGLGGRISRLFYKWQPSDVETMDTEL